MGIPRKCGGCILLLRTSNVDDFLDEEVFSEESEIRAKVENRRDEIHGIIREADSADIYIFFG